MVREVVLNSRVGKVYPVKVCDKNKLCKPVTGWLPQKVLGLRLGFPEYYVDKSNNNQRKIR